MRWKHSGHMVNMKYEVGQSNNLGWLTGWQSTYHVMPSQSGCCAYSIGALLQRPQHLIILFDCHGWYG
jgi:hypothetical protein